MYNLSIDEVLSKLASRSSGLYNGEVLNSRNTFGINVIDKEKRRKLLVRFLMQFKNLMVLILLVSAVVSITISVMNQQASELFEGFVILFIVIMNAIVGVVQENKAETCINELRKSENSSARVLRDGIQQIIPTQDLVVGDIVFIEAGDIVPADIRLIETNCLKCDESKLTGESISINKDGNIICKEDTGIAERINIAHSGSIVTSGKAKGVVIAVGNNTEIGKIAHLLFNAKKELTPLQKSIEKIGKFITFSVLTVCVVIFILELLCIKDSNFVKALMTSVALAVAAIPESLPAVITLIMAMGVQQLAKRKVVIKQLHAVETLGSCEIICTDKTGTLTENKMSVVEVYCNNHFVQNDNNLSDNLLNCMSMCNNSYFSVKNQVVGEPTENAILEYVNKFKIKKHKRIQEITFDSNRKMMTTLNLIDNKLVSYTKGAFDRIITLCSHIEVRGNIIPLSESIKQNLIKANDDMADRALRVLAFCYKQYNSIDETHNMEEKMIFVGLCGMMDRPRSGVDRAIKKCFKAGLKPIMITGDHKRTAFAIAKELGIAKDINQVLTGEEINQMSDKEFADNVQKYTVFARVSPEHKVKIVSVYKKLKKIVAMTGDGVNDAPSLKIADIGVGMGMTGTDMVKSVADMIITDDNFTSIVVAVEEGRKVYNNIQKALQYLISTNSVEVFGLLIGLIFFPQHTFLLPSQMLFINLVSDSLPAFALGSENVEPEIMKKPPRKSNSTLFSQDVGISIIYQSVLQIVIVVGMYIYALNTFSPEIATTMTFFTIVFMQLIHSINVKTNQSILGKNLFDNKIFNVCFIVSLVISLLVAVCPICYVVFRLEFLTLSQWISVILASVSIVPACEVVKLFLNYRKVKSFRFSTTYVKNK